MSNPIKDNMAKFDAIQGNVSNVANSFKTMFGRKSDGDADADVASQVQNIGSGVESGARLYTDAKDMIHRIKGVGATKNILAEMKKQGIANAQHMLKNNTNIPDSIKSKLLNDKDKTSSPGTSDPATSTSSTGTPSTPRTPATSKTPAKGTLKDSEDPSSKARSILDKEGQDFEDMANGNFSSLDPSKMAQDKASSQAPAPAQSDESSPSADPIKQSSVPRNPTGANDIGNDIASPNTKTTSTNDDSGGDSSRPSKGTGNDAEDAENVGKDANKISKVDEDVSEGSKIAKTVSTTSKVVDGLEGAGSALDEIPVVGLALQAIGGISSAIAGAIHKKPPAPPPPPKISPVSVGGDFSTSQITAGGSRV